MKKNLVKYLLTVLCVAFCLSGCGGAGRTVVNSETKSEDRDKEDDEEERDVKEEKDKEEKDKEKKDKEKKDTQKENKEDDEQDKDVVENDDIVDDEEKKDTDSELETKEGVYNIAINGVMMQIPRTFNVSVHDEDSIMLTEADYKYEMRLLVRNESYTESLKDMDSLAEKLEGLDVIILEDMHECKINGKSYAYCTYKYEDEEYVYMLAYTGAAGDNRIGMNIMAYSEMSDEELLEEIDKFVHDTEETDQPNTTEEELSKANNVTTSEAVESVDFEVASGKYRTKVPAGFYLRDSYQSDDSCETHFFDSEYETIDATARIFAVECEFNIEQYLKDETDRDFSSEYSNIEISKVKKEEVNGNTVYYATMSYDYSDTHYDKLFAAFYLPDGAAFVFDAGTLYEEELSLELFEGFMNAEKID